MKCWVPKALACLCCTVAMSCDPSGGVGPWELRERRTYLPSIGMLEQYEHSLVRAPSTETLEVILPLGMLREDFALIGRERVELAAGAKVLEPRQKSYQWGAFIAGMGSVTIGEGARVGGIYNLGEGPTIIRRRASVSGYIKVAGEVERSPEAVVRVGVLEHVAPNLEMYSFSVTLPQQGKDVTHSDPTRSLALAPGAYGGVRVEAGCVLRISTGEYSLREMALDRGARLDIDNSGGPVYIWVGEELSLSGEMVSLSPLRNVLLGFVGDSELELASPLRATLVAPHAHVALLAAPKHHEGSVFARAITVAERAHLEHYRFSDQQE